MKDYKNIITLIKNNRKCYILDTVKGCSICKHRPLGCYNNCYAKNISSRYGFNFSKPVNRNFYKDNKQLYMKGFYDTKHIGEIVNRIKNIPFIRIGEMGDPSEDWEHTINICKEISIAKKPIVIITKHLKPIKDNLLYEIKKLNIHINTSVSALDNNQEIKYRLSQFKRLKNYCNSILRIISCDFNKQNNMGKLKLEIQNKLFKNNKVIDTVFRPNINNILVKNNIINIVKIKFLKSYVYASMFNTNTHFGYCDTCPEMCGINL